MRRITASAIIEAFDAITKLPDANEPFPHYLAAGTILDHSYHDLITALSEMSGGDDYLRQITGSLEGKALWCVVMARARRGDTSVKTDLYNIINNPSETLYRCFAVRSLSSIGTIDDLPFLRELEKTDPFVTEVQSDLMVDGKILINRIYPVRLEAGWAIKFIEKKYKK